jgi:hypothetical protein
VKRAWPDKLELGVFTHRFFKACKAVRSERPAQTFVLGHSNIFPFHASLNAKDVLRVNLLLASSFYNHSELSEITSRSSEHGKT